MEKDKVKRVIIAKKKRINFNNPNLGVVHPLAENVGDYYQTLNTENFCETGEVFITGNYQTHIDDKFSDEEIFKITVHESLHVSNSIAEGSENNASKCKYVANGFEVESLKPKDIAHIISVSGFPDPNDRFIESEFLPSTSYIYIQDESLVCYGPFKWAKEGGGFSIQFIDAPFPVYKNLQKSHVFKFDVSQFSNCIYESNQMSFVFNMTDIHNKAEYFDYSSDEDVVKYFIQQANECGLKIEKVQLNSLEAALKRNPKPHMKSPLFKKNFERLIGIVSVTETARDEIAEGVQKFFRSDVAADIVSTYISKNEEKYFEAIKQKYKAEIERSIQNKKEEYELLAAKHNGLNAEINKLSKDIERLKEQKESSTEEDYLEKGRQVDDNLRLKLEESAKLQKDFDILSEKYSGLKLLSDIEQEVKEKKDHMRFLNKDILELETNKKTVQSQIQSSNEELQKKLMELKPYVDAINGAFISSDITLPSVAVKIEPFETKNRSKIDRQLTIIESIYVQIKIKNPTRTVERVDVANMIFCTQQSFITFLAGLPGVGKTSFSRLFVDAQNLKPRFKEISVSRGWTGQKDLIGFHNPLVNRFQPSQTGLYQFLLALHEEMKKDLKNSPMAYILLDEANLSPIEHYWASFMGMTDTKEKKSIQLGQNVIGIPDHLRFIATINYDSTTEPLSPRVIDRAPIVVVDGDAVNTDLVGSIDESLCGLPIASKDLEELFGWLHDANLDESELKTFSSIQQELLQSNKDYGRPVHLSARKINSIKQYCAQARAVMRHLSLNQDDSEFVALDFAVLQFVLPQIRGNGVKFKRRLDSLLNVLQSHRLARSAKYLERMISYGEDELHTYDFFCW